jgi:hypothetical protein
MQTVPYKIEQLIRMARAGQLTIPEFQREFVWKEPQVRKLVDSVARGYPIGSILLLKRSEKANFAFRTIDAVEQPPDPADESTMHADRRDDKAVYYILDGQQRVTSLVRVFANAHPNGKYHFDVRNLKNIHTADEVGHDDWFIFDRSRRPRTPVLYRQDKWFLRTQGVLDSKKVSILVDEYFDEVPELDARARREAKAVVSSVFETIRNFEVPAVIMDEKSDLEAICRVFETINSTGTRLTTFDLATAKFYPTPNLRDSWKEAQRLHEEFGALELDGERVLQIVALWVSHLSQRRFEPSRSNLLSLPKDEIERYWTSAARALGEAGRWIVKRGVLNRRSLPNEAILVPLAAAMSNEFHAAAKLQPKTGFHDFLDSWYWRCSLARTFEASTNERIATEFGRLVQLIETGELDFGSNPLVLSPRILTGVGAQRDSRARVILSFLLARSARDIKTGEDITQHTEYESHHIFPRSRVEKHPYRESVINRIWILKKTNRELGNRSPLDYLLEEARTAERDGRRAKLEERLKAQCIPLEALEAYRDNPIEEAFDAFLDERAIQILNLLVDRIGPRYIELSTASDADSAAGDADGDDD